MSGDCTPCTATLEVGIVEASSGQPLNNVLKGELTARLNGGVACFSSVVLHLAARPSLKRMLALRLVVRATERCRSEAPIRPLVSRTIVVHNRPTMPSRLSAAARLIVDGDAVGEKPRAHRVLASSGRPVASVTRADGAPRAASPPHGDVALVCADESDDEALHDASLFTDVLEMLDDADADADADVPVYRKLRVFDESSARPTWLHAASPPHACTRPAAKDAPGKPAALTLVTKSTALELAAQLLIRVVLDAARSQTLLVALEKPCCWWRWWSAVARGPCATAEAKAAARRA